MQTFSDASSFGSLPGIKVESLHQPHGGTLRRILRAVALLFFLASCFTCLAPDERSSRFTPTGDDMSFNNKSDVKNHLSTKQPSRFVLPKTWTQPEGISEEPARDDSKNSPGDPMPVRVPIAKSN